LFSDRDETDSAGPNPTVADTTGATATDAVHSVALAADAAIAVINSAVAVSSVGQEKTEGADEAYDDDDDATIFQISGELWKRKWWTAVGLWSRLNWTSCCRMTTL
jgi:hypothetical protein